MKMHLVDSKFYLVSGFKNDNEHFCYLVFVEYLSMADTELHRMEALSILEIHPILAPKGCQEDMDLEGIENQLQM